MKTLDIEIAIMQFIGVRANVVVHGVHWGMRLGNKSMHECDILSLNKTGYATEVEIKISKADLLKDKEKKHGHNHNYLKYLWFAVPEKLQEIALTEIPSRAGLLVCYNKYNKNYIKEIRKPIPNKKAVKWTDKERMQLMRLGTMRILNLKKNLQKLKK